MLIDKMKKSKELGDAYLTSNDSTNQLNDLRHIYDEFDKNNGAIKEALIGAGNLVYINETLPQEHKQIIRQLEELSNNITEREFKNALNNIEYLNVLSAGLEQVLIDKWNHYKSRHLNNIKQTINALSAIIGNNNNLDKLHQIERTIYAAKYANQECVNKIAEYQKDAHGLIKSLDMSPAIEDFFTKLSKGEELSLNDLSEETMEWLKKNKFAKKIRVSI